MVFVLLQSSFRTSLKNSCPKRHVDFHTVSQQSLRQVLLTHAVSPSAGCASSCPQNCFCLWYPLIYPIKPVCGAACEMGHVIWLIIIMGGGHCLILGLLLTWICPIAWFITQVMQVATAPLGNFILLNHLVNSRQRLFLIERDMC